jgi:hypothetical protein
MVYEKRKSGDPDFDDKVPPGEHGRVVTAGDGTPVALLSESVGPVTLDGEHYNLGGEKAEDLDTRPAPGEVAEVKAEVQTYEPEDVPFEEVSEEDAEKEQAEGGPAAGQSGDQVNLANAQQEPTPAKKTAASKATAKNTADENK